MNIHAAEPPLQKPIFHPSLKSASDAAAADQNLVLLIFSAGWCAPCKQLKKNTLDSPEFLEQGGGLHLAEVDVDSDAKAARDFSIEAVPTLILLTADSKIVERRTGYLETAELLPWIQEGRRRAAAGQWEGTAPSAKPDEFAKKAAADDLTTNDLQRLVAMLGETDPVDRAAVGKILLAQREQAVPLLIAGVGDNYLGTRIAASELLQQLAPGTMSVDPWQSPAELSGAVAALKKWWAETGRLPPLAPAPRVADSSAEDSIKKALEMLRGDDPTRRTEAMTALTGQDAAALPAVRDAIKRSERTGDQRSILLLEDVRWAILVPDPVEQRAGVRSALARGTSQERQAAAARLGRVGRDALDALAELAGDADPLVVESAVRALSGIGGKDAIPAMAALLRAADSNVRMTAAQALGHTKNSDAVKPLLTVFDDPNEIVACTAISALEEIRSNSRSSRDSTGSEIVAALKGCLSDSRWRVRAAAVEVIGKLSVHELAGDLKRLLDDPDGFVVKNTLTALCQLNAAPTAEQLAALGKRLPSLRGEAVEMLLQSESDETIKTVTEIFDTSRPEEQVTVLNALARHVNYNDQSDDGWKPLLTRATTASDPKLRRAAAEVIGGRSPKLAAELVGPLLADDDSETRGAAARVVINIMARAASKLPNNRFNALAIMNGHPVNSGLNTVPTNSAFATAERVAAWHTTLLQHPASPPDLRIAAALFATGDRKSDLPALAAALDKPDSKDIKWLEDSSALELILSQLPWPEGRPLLEKFCGSPRLFAVAARDSGRTASSVSDFLLEPSRFKATMERASGDELTGALQLLAGYNYNEQAGWSLWIETDRTKAIAVALADSTNAAWRAAAVFSLGQRGDAEKNQAVFEKAVADSNVWVRGAAAQSLARATKDRAALEQRMAPLLAGTDLRVATIAAIALLEPEVAQAAPSQKMELSAFQFEGVYGGRNEFSNQSDERPLTTLEGKPAFLQSARDWLTKTNAANGAAFALLLAQYSEFDGLDRLIADKAEFGGAERGLLPDAVLGGIALSRDPKYIPALRRMMETAGDEWSLRKILQALKGMTGPDARQLRLDVNKRIRDTAGSSVVPD